MVFFLVTLFWKLYNNWREYFSVKQVQVSSNHVISVHFSNTELFFLTLLYLYIDLKG